MKVAIIGTVGVPANYGGFETIAEQLILHNNDKNLQYTVFCSAKSYEEKHSVYKGAKIEYIDLNANGIQSIPYDILSLIKATKDNDVILILGVSGCAFLPIYRLFSKKRLIINIDGLEHRRDKWGKFAKWFLKFSEKQAVKFGDVVISDNKYIADYVLEEYGINSELIAYGGDQVIQDVGEDEFNSIFNNYKVMPKKYSLGICRIEPENNVHLVVDAFSRMPDQTLVFIGNWQRTQYGRDLLEKYSNFPNIKLCPAVYDLHILNVLRANCKFYIHGHSAGGTNPSLVEAMFFGIPIISYDCIYNKESTEHKAHYFNSSDNLIALLNSDCANFQTNADNMMEIANRRYRWEYIASQYESIFLKS